MGKRKRFHVEIDKCDDVSIFRHGVSTPTSAKRQSTEPMTPLGVPTTSASLISARTAKSEPLSNQTSVDSLKPVIDASKLSPQPASSPTPIHAQGAFPTPESQSRGPELLTEQDENNNPIPHKHATKTATEVVVLDQDESYVEVVNASGTPHTSRSPSVADASTLAPPALVPVKKPPPITIRYNCLIPGKEGSGEEVVPRDTPLYEFYEDILSIADDDFVSFHKGARIASYLTPAQILAPEMTILELEVINKEQLAQREIEAEQKYALEAEAGTETGAQAEPDSKQTLGDAEVSVNDQPTGDEDYFLIYINFKDNKNLKLFVKEDTNMSKVVQFIKTKKPDTQTTVKGIKLVFDDEAMDLDKSIGDYDLEADDCIDAYY